MVDTPTVEMAADIFTKAIPEVQKFHDPCTMINVFDPDAFLEALWRMIKQAEERREHPKTVRR